MHFVVHMCHPLLIVTSLTYISTSKVMTSTKLMFNVGWTNESLEITLAHIPMNTDPS